MRKVVNPVRLLLYVGITYSAQVARSGSYGIIARYKVAPCRLPSGERKNQFNKFCFLISGVYLAIGEESTHRQAHDIVVVLGNRTYRGSRQVQHRILSVPVQARCSYLP